MGKKLAKKNLTKIKMDRMRDRIISQLIFADINQNIMKNSLTIILLVFIPIIISAQELHIYGGEKRDVYLGCLNCNKYDSKSIWNAYGSYGSKYSATSIWNAYGSYGGKYSQYSPFNCYSNSPPAIVDNRGGFYGYLSSNNFVTNRADFSLANTICKYWEEIKEDVSSWYDEIF
jgi:hypothetical protein